MKNNRDNGTLGKMSENKNIWHKINENTKKLMILDDDKIFSSSYIKRFHQEMQLIDGNYNLRYLEPPKCVIINTSDNYDIKIENLKGLPEKLPNLEELRIHNFKEIGGLKLKSLIGIPKDLPNLKYISLGSKVLHNLKGLPSKLHSLEFLSIGGTPLESLRYLPKSLPKLEEISIIRTNIESLKFFPTNIPVLSSIRITENKNLISLEGLPPEIPKLNNFTLFNNNLSSLEQLPSTFVGDIKNAFSVYGNPIRTLAGIKNIYIINNIVETAYELHDLPLCPTALRLIDDYNEKKIREDVLTVDENTGEVVNFRMHMDPARLNAIFVFYSKSPMELAQQYVENPKSLTKGELERLSWEGGYKERKLLESNFPPDNPVLMEISKRLTHQLPSGLSILK